MPEPQYGRRRLLLGAAGLAGTAVLGGCTTNLSSPPKATVTGRTVRWSASFPCGYDDDPYPRVVSVQGGTVFAGQGGTLHALSAATGKKRWSSRSGPVDTYGLPTLRACAPVPAGGLLYVMRNVSGKPGALHAVDAATGTARWTFADTDSAISPPAVSGDTVCFTTATHLIALDARTGRQRWKVGSAKGTPLTAGAPAIGHGVVCLADLTNVVAGLDAATGALRWIQPGTQHTDLGSNARAMRIVGDTLYASWYFAIDVADGTIRWSSDATDIPMGLTPVTATADALYVSDGAGGDAARLAALDAATGRTLWSVAVGGRSTVTIGPPAVLDGTVSVGTTAHGVYAVDARTGRARWHLDTAGARTGGPAAAGDTVYVFVRTKSDAGWTDHLYALAA